MTASDQVILALTCWRENRGGGYAGMQSVANVVMNRAKKSGRSPYAECVLPWQFSSITAAGDPQLDVWPHENDSVWVTALGIADAAISGSLPDVTDGATSYYSSRMKQAPKWSASMTKTVEIGGQIFFK